MVDPAKVREKLTEIVTPATKVTGDIVSPMPLTCQHIFAATEDDPTVRCINCGQPKFVAP